MENINPDTHEVTFLGLARSTLGVIRARWKVFTVIITCLTLTNIGTSTIGQHLSGALNLATQTVLSTLSFTFFTLVTLLTVKNVFAGSNPLSSRGYAKRIRKYYWGMLATCVMKGVYIGVGILCFIVPGLIMITRYLFAESIVVFEDEDGSQALENSATHVKGQFFRCAGYALGLILVLHGYDLVSALANHNATAITAVESVTVLGAAVSSVITSIKSTIACTWWAVAYMGLRQPEQF
jgi:hypothetical protein